MTTATLSPGITLDPTDDDPYIRLDDAPRYVPGRPHRATIWRWASSGVCRGGEHIILRSIVSGGRRWTQRAWIDEFLAALNTGNPSCAPAPGAARARRDRQARSAMAALAAR